MDVFEAVDTRLSCRAYLDKLVDPAILRELVARAGRAASGSNIQPWHVYVVSGEALSVLKQKVGVAIRDHDPRHGPTEYPFHPPDLWEPYQSRREGHGAEFYGALGIPRADIEGRLGQYKRNFEFFGAPAGLFVTIERRMGVGQWADLGSFVSTIMYLARGYDLDTCPQQSWQRVHKILGEILGIPADQMLYCGISIGYGDRTHPANRFRSTRAPVAEYATFIDTPRVIAREQHSAH